MFTISVTKVQQLFYMTKYFNEKIIFNIKKSIKFCLSAKKVVSLQQKNKISDIKYNM